MRQYAQNFGPNSFYAQAPRVRNWDNFKTKLTVMEALSYKDEQHPLPNPSPEMAATMDSFIKSLPNRRPSWLSHLRSPVFRLIYAVLPMTALILFAAWNHRTDFDGWLHDFGSEIVLYFVIVTGPLFGLLTVINALADNLHSVLPKAVRAYLFLSICWAIMSFFVLLLFDPLDYGGFDYMDGRQITQAIFIIVGLPFLSGIAFYSFKRFVK